MVGEEGATSREAFASAHGTNALELHLLFYVRMEAAPPDDYLQYARNLENVCGPPPPDDPTWRDRYRAALDRLMARGLVTIVTPEVFDAEQARIARAEVPELVRQSVGRPGFVEFTPEGYALRREYVRAALGDEGLVKSESGWNLSPDRTRFDVYAASAARCTELLDEVAQKPEAYTFLRPCVVAWRTEPAEIGPWRPNPFILLPRGFHAQLRLEPPPA